MQEYSGTVPILRVMRNHGLLHRTDVYKLYLLYAPSLSLAGMHGIRPGRLERHEGNRGPAEPGSLQGTRHPMYGFAPFRL